MTVRDCEHHRLSPDTNGKDWSASPLSMICSAGFRKTFFKFVSFFQTLILGKEKCVKIGHLSSHLKKCEKEEQIQRQVIKIKQKSAKYKTNNGKSQRLVLRKYK